jgi:hypothetical protein
MFGGYVLHIGYLKYGNLNVGNEIVATYEEVNNFESFFNFIFLLSSLSLFLVTTMAIEK